MVGRRADGTYALVTRKLTVTDLSRLEGPVTRFWARGQLASTTDASGNPNGMGVDGGHAMALQLDDKDGTFVARDFDSLMAMTIYDHLARGRRTSRRWAWGPTPRRSRPCPPSTCPPSRSWAWACR